MQRVVAETNECIHAISSQRTLHDVGGVLPDELMAALLYESSAIAFNKRCALSYLHSRLQRVQAAWWDSRGLFSEQNVEVRDAMAAHELSFFAEYGQLLSRYALSSGVEVTGARLPPRSVWVMVEVLRSVEPLLGVDGQPISLTAGHRKRMKRVDADNLITQGLAALVD